ncbi:hypothetical protein COD78_21235 [Bacillus cereus]|nr:hypothetical protein [Bacillus cereus]PEX06989.1 hypothetical protein CN454_26835 [Bacillus cereus]PGV20129.1 hypothetical protein COD78_21235 [Bacillus cereus]
MVVTVNMLFNPKQQGTIHQDTTGITLEVNEGTIGFHLVELNTSLNDLRKQAHLNEDTGST